MGKVLFTSSRPLGRCENVTAVYDAWDGPKEFRRLGRGVADNTSGTFGAIVTDEFIGGVLGERCPVVMIGHGANGGKVYGLDQPRPYVGPEVSDIHDWYVATSEDGRASAMSASGLSADRCPALGFPRTDSLVGRKKGDGGTFLAKFRRAYLWCPTFRRGATETPAPKLDFEAIDADLNDDEILVVKRHMVVYAPLARSGLTHVVEVTNSEPTGPYLIDCDVLATDYSSTMFDAYAIGRPVALWHPDSADYLARRGMYYEYPAAYAPTHSDGTTGFVEMLRKAAETSAESLLPYRERFVGACDGHSTQRVMDFVRRVMR